MSRGTTPGFASGGMNSPVLHLGRAQEPKQLRVSENLHPTADTKMQKNVVSGQTKIIKTDNSGYQK